MKKLVTMILCVAMVLAMGVGAVAEEKDTINLGAMLILTTEPLSGAAYRNSYEMAINEINEAGGVLGKQLVLHGEDMGMTTDMAVNACNKLLARGDLDMIIGCALSGAGLAVEKSVKEAGIPLLLSGTSPKLAEIDNEYVFRMRSSDSVLGSVAMTFATDEFNLDETSTVAVLYVNSDFGVGGYDTIKAYCDENGINCVSETFNQDDPDATAQVLNLKNANPDLLVVWSTGTGFTVASRCIAEQGLECPVLGSAGLCQKATLDVCATWVEGWYSICDAIMTADEPELKAFVEKYTELYGAESLSYDCPTAYSTIYMIKDAYERAGSTDTQAFLQAMRETESCKTILGNYHHFGNIEMASCAAIGRIDNGELTYIKSVEADLH